MTAPNKEITSQMFDLTNSNTSGTRMGQSATDGICFWGVSTPVTQSFTTGSLTTGVQPSGSGGVSITIGTTFTGGTGTLDYTIGDIVYQLKRLGLLAS